MAHPQINLHLDLDELLLGLNRSLRGMGELLPPRRVQPRLLARSTITHGSDRRLDPPQIRTPHVLRKLPPVLRSRLALRPQRGHLPRRIQRRDHPLPLPRHTDTEPLDHHRASARLISERGTRRARCGETRTAGGTAACGNGPGATPAPRRRPTALKDPGQPAGLQRRTGVRTGRCSTKQFSTVRLRTSQSTTRCYFDLLPRSRAHRVRVYDRAALPGP